MTDRFEGPALILAGGRGTRLGHLTDECPKPMMPVLGRPFLSHIVDALALQGIRRFHLLTGYRAEQIENHFRALGDGDLTFSFTRESAPLGTGGAVRNALDDLESDGPFLLLNGDSFVSFDVQAVAALPAGTDGMVLAVSAPEENRYGNLEINEDGTLVSFAEKSSGSRSGWINAGVYFLRPELFADIRPGIASSIERELFPRWLTDGRRFEAVRVEAPLLDIGTPRDLARAESFLRNTAAMELRGTGK